MFDLDDVEFSEIVKLTVLTDVVFNSEASRFRSLGGKFYAAFVHTQRQAFVAFTSTGCSLSIEEYSALFQEMLEAAARDCCGISTETVTAALNKYELAQKEVGNHFGISIANKIFMGWLYG